MKLIVRIFSPSNRHNYEVVYVKIGNRAFCLVLYLNGVHFRGELQQVGHVGERKINCWPIRTREIAGVRLSDELWVIVRSHWYHHDYSKNRQRSMRIHLLFCFQNFYGSGHLDLSIVKCLPNIWKIPLKELMFKETPQQYFPRFCIDN